MQSNTLSRNWEISNLKVLLRNLKEISPNLRFNFTNLELFVSDYLKEYRPVEELKNNYFNTQFAIHALLDNHYPKEKVAELTLDTESDALLIEAHKSTIPRLIAQALDNMVDKIPNHQFIQQVERLIEDIDHDIKPNYIPTTELDFIALEVGRQILQEHAGQVIAGSHEIYHFALKYKHEKKIDLDLAGKCLREHTYQIIQGNYHVNYVPLVWDMTTWVICNDPEKVAGKLFAIFVATKVTEFTAQHLDCYQKEFAIDNLLEIIDQLLEEKEDI